jgi:tRNA pseudouridine32 synthase/23S rRNA pseudouridine746 synthase
MPNSTLLEILHTDPEFVVVNKDPGMLSVPGRGPEKVDSVTDRVKRMFPDCISHPAVHRLDMDTSGLMVVARTADAQRHLSRQFQSRQTSKRYIAILEGILPDHLGDSGTIELPFRLDIDNRPIQIYDEVHGKMGITHWQKISEENGHTRIEFIPVTGRTHQLRVHSAHPKGLGIPIVGDPFYGTRIGPRDMKLHACELSFFHPNTGEPLTFFSKPTF